MAADSTSPREPRQLTLTVMGTTDLHGHLFNWDYYRDAEYEDGAGDHVGLAKISTLVNRIRAERGTRDTLLVDAGDTIQGTPLATYYATVEPITASRIHPMAAAMNAMRYDAAALGNHEFNYGIPLLRTFADQLDFPLLGANAVDWDSGEPVFPPYAVTHAGPPDSPVQVGILGLTNPGIAIWDRALVEGKMRFPDVVEHAQRWVPELRAMGCDVVIVAAHSGASSSSSYGDALPWLENASDLVARHVPGIDAILVGHAHVEIAERFITNEQIGRDVLLTEPLYFGKRLSVIELDLEPSPSRAAAWEVAAAHSRILHSSTAPEDERIVELLRGDHERVVAYANTVIGRSAAPMSAATARYEDTAVVGFVNHVQARRLKHELAGSNVSHLPVLSVTAPFNRNAAVPEGDVSMRDVAALYIFDNTLIGVRITGAQLRDYLETAAGFFRQVPDPGPHHPDDVTNARTENFPRGAPDYSYDIVAGFDARLSYDIDIAQPVGRRITRLAYDGAPVRDEQEFVLGTNNYRQAGTGMYPHVRDADVVHDRQLSIRQLLVDYVTDVETIDPSTFASVDWRLVADGIPVIVDPNGGPCA